MKFKEDYPLRPPVETGSFTMDGMLQSSQVADRDLAVFLYRDFGEGIALAALERFHDGALARRALQEVLAEAVSTRQKYWADQPLSEWMGKIQEQTFRRIGRRIPPTNHKKDGVPANPAEDRAAFITTIEGDAHKQQLHQRAIQWCAAAVALLVLIGYFVRQLQLASQPRKWIEVLPVQSYGPKPISEMVMILSLVGDILVMILLFWILRKHPAGRLYAMLVSWIITMSLYLWFSRLIYDLPIDFNILMGSFALPVYFTIIVNEYLWLNRKRWRRTTWLVVFAAFAILLAILCSPWVLHLFSRVDQVLFFYIMLGFGLITLLIWLIFSLPGYWKTISVVIMILWMIAEGIWWLMSYAINIHFSLDMTLNGIIVLASYLYPLFASVLLGWWIYSSLLAASISRRGLWLRIGVGLLVFASLFIATQGIVINTNFGENSNIFVILILFMITAGLLPAGGVIVLRLSGKRRLIGLGLLLAVLVGQFPTGIFTNSNMTDPINERRAVRIDLAIRQYFQDRGTYPPSLEALAPGYLLLVPRPVTYLTYEWCYVSGRDYYRLGYPYPGQWTYPGEVKLREFSGGNLPGGKSECEKELTEWKSHLW